MQSSYINNSSNNITTTYTIPHEEPKHLVLTLRNEKNKKEIEIQKKETNCFNTSSCKSAITIEIFEKSVNDIQISPTNSSEEDERVYTNLADEQDLNLLKQDNAITTNQLIAAETHIEEIETLQNQISTFDLLSAHFSNFMGLNGTTTVTATGAMAYGIATVTTGGLANFFLGAGALAVSANEFAKMLKRYLNDKGASDHLKAIETTLTNLENKRKVSSALIKDAKALNLTIDLGLTDIEKKIAFLRHQLEHSSGHLQEIIAKALDNAEMTKQRLEIQQSLIKNAIKENAFANNVIIKQQGLIENLLNNVLADDIDENNINDIIAQVKAKLIEIQSNSSKAYDHQTNANRSMMDVLQMTQEIMGLEDQQIKLILEIQIIEKELGKAQKQVVEIQEELKEVKEENGALKENLAAQEKNTKEMKNDIQIGKDALQAEKEVEKFGAESMILGNTAAVTTMMLGGFMTFGPPGAMVGALAGSIFVSHPAAIIAHYARKSIKANNTVKLEKAFALCSNNFAEGKFDKKILIKIQAEFTYNNAPLFGAGIYKMPYNLFVSGINMICTEQREHWKSKRGGFINCQIGGVTLPQLQFYGHTSYNATYANYGAISIDDQQQLCQLLTMALENDQICPQELLKFFYQMQCVKVEGIEIMMISPDSKVMEALKRMCVDKQLVEKK